MLIDRLTVEAFRGFAAKATLDFHPQWTVIVGENGVGKTSSLWALRVLLSHLTATFPKTRAKPLVFASGDVSRGWPFLRAEVSLLADSGARVRFSAQKNLESFVKGMSDDGRPRQHAVDTPDTYTLHAEDELARLAWKTETPPLVVYYSAHRSLAMERGLRKTRAAGGIASAYADAFEDRELRLGEASDLWRKEAALEISDGLPARANHAIERALPAFLGEFANLRVEGDGKPRLVVDKRRIKLDLSELSEGERGLLSILLDLTRRLAVANPSLDEPAANGRAIVLIDELDLHMHPRWQRSIVSKLSTAFPNCQFIGSTHSPQILSEVQPDSLILLRQVNDKIVPETCGQAYGLDVNYVLKHIMGTESRPRPVEEAIRRVEDALDGGDLSSARTNLDTVRVLLHGEDPRIVELEATINNLEALGDAPDPEEG